MCGRFAQSQPVIHYAHALDPVWEPLPLALKPTWNMAPGRDVLVFHDSEAGHVAGLQHWGLLPAWADPKAQKPINARAETAASKPYFRKAWKSGRCVIPADGWFEWKQGERGKQPYFIYRADEQPILMAGLYDTNPHAHITTFAILTADACGFKTKVVGHTSMRSMTQKHLRTPAQAVNQMIRGRYADVVHAVLFGSS